MENRFFILEKEELPVFQGLYMKPYPIRDDQLAFGVMTDGKPSAFALFDYIRDGSSYWLDWLYVEPVFRRQKVGSFLLRSVLNILSDQELADEVQTGCVNEEQRGFLSSMGFLIQAEKNVTVYEGTLSMVTGLSSEKEVASAKRFSEITEDELHALVDDLIADPEAVPYRIEPGSYLDASLYMRNENGLEALLLLQEEEDAIAVSYAYAKQKDGIMLIRLLCMALPMIRNAYPPEKKLRITAMNRKVCNLVEKVLPEAEKTQVYTASYDVFMD